MWLGLRACEREGGEGGGGEREKVVAIECPCGEGSSVSHQLADDAITTARMCRRDNTCTHAPTTCIGQEAGLPHQWALVGHWCDVLPGKGRAGAEGEDGDREREKGGEGGELRAMSKGPRGL